MDAVWWVLIALVVLFLLGIVSFNLNIGGTAGSQ